jgi:hypothetical protein
MATVIATNLTAVVVYREERTLGPNGRRKQLTEVTVKAGPLTVATKTLWGRYSQSKALVEFKRNPKGWVIHNEGAAKMPIAA